MLQWVNGCEHNLSSSVGSLGELTRIPEMDQFRRVYVRVAAVALRSVVPFMLKGGKHCYDLRLMLLLDLSAFTL